MVNIMRLRTSHKGIDDGKPNIGEVHIEEPTQPRLGNIFKNYEPPCSKPSMYYQCLMQGNY